MNFNRLNLSLLFGLILLLGACSTEDAEIMPNEIESVESAILLTRCDIIGSTTLVPNSTQTYSVSTSISDPIYEWEVVSGNATIVSNGSANVAIQIGSGCSDIRLQVNLDGRRLDCSTDILISCAAPPTCNYFRPTVRAINSITGQHNTFCNEERIMASVTQPLNGRRVKWSITPSIPVVGGNINSFYVEFGDTSQHSQYQITATFYCASGAVSGIRKLTVNQTGVNCHWIPI